MKEIRNSNPRTQKARGVRAVCREVQFLTTNPFNKIFLVDCTEKFDLTTFPDTMSLETFFWKWGFIPPWSPPIIARPCPVTPRHGFVESRIISTVGELRAILAETYQADPRGEILLMVFLANTQVSSVVTNQSVTVGTQHDGATAGRDGVAVPCVSNIATWIDNMLPGFEVVDGCGRAKVIPRSRYIGLTSSLSRQPYIEMVGLAIVQARYGPIDILGATNWHPYGVASSTFTFIWEPNTVTLQDFFEFEQLLKKLKEDRGDNLLLYLPHGTLTCHAAVQAICHQVAVVTGPIRPKVYEPVIFQPNTAQKYPLATIQRAVQQGLQIGRTYHIPDDLQERGGLVLWAAGIIQGTATCPLSPQQAALLATASVLLLRFGAAACFGEHRHWRTGVKCITYDYPQPLVAPNKTLTFPAKYSAQAAIKKVGRASVYTKCLAPTFFTRGSIYTLLGKLHACQVDFTDNPWKYGFGGKAWGACTAATISLLTAYMRVSLQTPRQDTTILCTFKTSFLRDLAILQRAANTFVTISHNNGKCLTKFVTGRDLQGVTYAPGLYLTHELTREVYHAV